MKSIKTDETKVLSKLIKKCGKIKKINTPKLRGSAEIVSLRKYRYGNTLNYYIYKVSVNFTGQIYSPYTGKWYSISDKKSLSIRKVNRVIRTELLPIVNLNLSILDVKLNNKEYIDKLKWVE